jgi:hypothetical protein
MRADELLQQLGSCLQSVADGDGTVTRESFQTHGRLGKPTNPDDRRRDQAMGN